MKLNKLLLGLFACTAFFACTNETEEGAVAPGSGSKKYETNYLSVKIVSNESTRADGSEDFEDAAPTTAECTIDKIRFYFFDAAGSASHVIAPRLTSAAEDGNGTQIVDDENTHLNYIDWENPNKNTDTNPSVEAKTDVTLLINTEEGDKLPEQIIAIVNPQDVPVEGMHLNEIRNKVFTNNEQPRSDGKFTMINSSYLDGSTLKYAATLNRSNFQKTSQDALNHPVNLYLERVVAKVVTVASVEGSEVKTTPGGTTLYGSNLTKNDKTILNTIDKSNTGTKIYIRLDGWDATCTLDQTYLQKHINPTWSTAQILGNGNNWNDAGNRRSYWAYTPYTTSSSPKAQYNFSTYATHAAKRTSFTSTNNKNILYVSENASQDREGYALPEINRTSLIVAATLCTEDGTPISIAEWKGVRLKEENLMETMLHDPYIMSMTKGSPAVAMDVNDFEFATIYDIKGTYPSENRYAVHVQLKKSLYNASTLATANLVVGGSVIDTEAELNAVNENLISETGQIKFWKNGRTYFYANIQHLGASGTAGEYGVVRNHVYRLALKQFVGLGTPVYDETEIIVPEKPVSDESYMAAQININAWRVVNNNIVFEW